MMDIDRVRCSRRLRKLVGRGLIRRLHIERCKLLLHFARAQAGAHKTSELVSEEDVISLDEILDYVDEYSCRLMQGCRDGTSLATWVRPAPPPPPPTPPDTIRSGAGMSARSAAGKTSARSTKFREEWGEEDEDGQNSGPPLKTRRVARTASCLCIRKSRKRLNRMETHLLLQCLLMRAECAAARRMFGKAADFEDLLCALADDANARMADIERSRSVTECCARCSTGAASFDE